MRRSLSVLAALALLPVPVARAQTPPPPPAGIVRIAAISPWTERERPFSLDVQITNPTELALENLTVRVAFYDKVFSRGQLGDALEGRRPTRLIAAVTEEVAARVAPGAQRVVPIRRPMSAFSGVRLTGVYPVEVTVAHAQGEVSAFTAVPYVGTPPAAPLNVAWVIPVGAPTAETGADAYTDAAIEALGLSTLTQQIEEIARRPRVPMTLSIRPSLLDTLERLADGFVRDNGGTRVSESETSATALAARALLDAIERASAGAHEIASATYASADLAGLTRAGMRDDIARQISLGRSTIQRHTGRVPHTGSMVPPGLALDAAGADALGAGGVDTIVVAPSVLPVQPTEPFQPQLFGPSRPVRLEGGGVTMRALLSDAALTARIEGPDEGVLTGQALIAETASAWLELPVLASERLLTVASGRLPSPPAVAHALDALASAPWVRMRTMSDAAAALPARGADLPFPPADRSLPRHVAAAREARRSLTTLGAIAVGAVPGGEDLERLVLLAESVEWRGDEARGVALARAVQNRVSAVVGAISVQARQVTLTARTGDVPVTLLNRNPFPVRVRVALASTRVEFPEGAGRVTQLEPEHSTLDFTVNALATGSFPIDVRVHTPEGGPLLTAGRVIVRSTAVSAVALLVTAGGAVFLFAASFRRDARRRKRAAHG